MKKIILLIIISALSISTVPVQALASEEPDLFGTLDYPELQVAPRATERLAQLAALEEDQGALLHWTTMGSGLATFVAGYTHRGKNKDNATEQQKQDSSYASTTAMGVGLAWMGLGGYFTYKRWATSRLSEIKRIPGKDKRSELARERMAEEAISTASETLKTLKYLSVATNFIASVYVSNNTPKDNQIYSTVSIAASFLPLLFPNAYEVAWEKQQDYKKKIYTPLVSWNFNNQLEPQLSFAWNF